MIRSYFKVCLIGYDAAYFCHDGTAPGRAAALRAARDAVAQHHPAKPSISSWLPDPEIPEIGVTHGTFTREKTAELLQAAGKKVHE